MKEYNDNDSSLAVHEITCKCGETYLFNDTRPIEKTSHIAYGICARCHNSEKADRLRENIKLSVGLVFFLFVFLCWHLL